MSEPRRAAGTIGSFDRARPPAERQAWLARQLRDEGLRGGSLRCFSATTAASSSKSRRSSPIDRLRPGATIGQYRIRSFLERGGMSEVYLPSASAPATKALVALKLLRPTCGRCRGPFRRGEESWRA
jgi:hypothetical protein